TIVGVTRYYKYGWNDKEKHIQRVDDLSPELEQEALRGFLKHHEIKHAIAVTSDNQFASQYQVSGIPQAVIIDRAGNIRMVRVGSGQQNADDLEKCIRECLAEPAG